MQTSFFDIEEAKARHTKLVDEVKKHRDLYEQKAAPEITDAEYDALYRELETLEEKFPVLKTADSPTQIVGSAPSKGFGKVTHALPMLSLGNAFSDEDVQDFSLSRSF